MHSEYSIHLFKSSLGNTARNAQTKDAGENISARPQWTTLNVDINATKARLPASQARLLSEKNESLPPSPIKLQPVTSTLEFLC